MLSTKAFLERIYSRSYEISSQIHDLKSSNFSHQAESTSTSKESWEISQRRYQWLVPLLRRISDSMFGLPCNRIPNLDGGPKSFWPKLRTPYRQVPGECMLPFILCCRSHYH